ncbi:extracellular solute-binding protein [Cohnella endophytica]|uniref:Extracellular solute-binding protein n=1 Tax=Cohnella endophytica TaxID=2419778 RepID=A0A494XMF7_9BACL|nr:extracellular solute-binding protein [Cohnella endophytica]RKP49866.1 extracellular solute-binding protein [Cohnella endophytica]
MLGKRISGLVLVLSLFGSLLAACSSNNNKENAPSSAAASQSASESAPDASASASPEDKSPITVDWFVSLDYYKKNWDAVNNLLDKMITDNTGITINFTSGNDDKLSALIAAGDLPDIVTLDKGAPQRGVLEKSGLVAPLDELIKQYAPDYQVPQSIQDWFRNADGHFYGYPSFFWAKENMKDGDRIRSNQGLYARKDIMDQLGIKPEDFATKEGLVAALKKVKDAKLKYNGFDVTPAYYESWNIENFFGAPREDEQGNLVDREYTPQALEAYKFMNRLYREGLIPQDSQTLTKDQVQEKVNNGAVFSTTNKNIDWSPLFHTDPNALFVHVGPVAGDSGNKPYVDPVNASGWTLTMINSKAEHQDRIIKLFQYLSSEEMSLNVNYGPKGEAWDFDENGKVKQSEAFLKLNAEDSNQAKLKYGNDTLGWFINWIPIQRTQPATVEQDQVAKLENGLFFGNYTYNMLPFENITPLGGTEEAGIKAKIEENRIKWRAKMILAKSEEAVAKAYNDGIEQEKKLGFDKLYAYQNQKYQEAKKALGLEHAGPALK